MVGTDSGQPDAADIFGAQLMIVCFQRGTMGDLVPLIEEAMAENPGIPAFVAALALAHAEEDRFDAARRLLEEFAATNFELPMDPAWISEMVAYAEAAIVCRDQEYAEPLLVPLAP